MGESDAHCHTLVSVGPWVKLIMEPLIVQVFKAGQPILSGVVKHVPNS
jgi:hypothetical protein